MESAFFTGQQVRVKIGSPTKQESTGRICLPLTMPLDDGLAKGWPDWITDAYSAVNTHAKKFVPDLEQVADISVMFNAESSKTPDLFELPDAKFPHSELKTFAVVREGDPNEWEVVLRFTMYSAFSRDGWAWLGEMAGKDVFMGFPRDLEKTGGAIAQGTAKQETMAYPPDTVPSADEAAILANDTKPEDTPGTPEYERKVRASMGAKDVGPRMVGDTPPEQRKRREIPGDKPTKSPKELAEFHAQESAKEEKRGRGAVTVN